MELRKFPVTSADGTEYRVKIEECHDSIFGMELSARLYAPRKRWGFRNIYAMTLRQLCGDYNPSDVDYVDVAAALVADYYGSLAEHAERQREKAEAAARKQAAVKRFNAWDGRITE